MGLSILRMRAKKARIDIVPQQGEYPIEDLQVLISKAHKQFNQLKRDDNQYDTWMAQLIAAQAAAWNKTKKALWQQVRSTEKIRRTANNVRKALKNQFCISPCQW